MQSGVQDHAAAAFGGVSLIEVDYPGFVVRRVPVSEATRHWFASPATAVGYFRHAAQIDLAALGADRAITVPGLSATVADQLAALERAAGPAALSLITRNPDPAVEKIVLGWALDFTATRALALGFTPDRDFDAIIAAHLAESP